MASFSEKADIFDDGIDLYFSFPRTGLALVFKSKRLESVMFYSQGRDDFDQYRGQLPFELRFEDNKQAVEEKVRITATLSGRVAVPFDGRTESNWVKYLFHDWALHVEFKSPALSEISLITVMVRRGLEKLS